MKTLLIVISLLAITSMAIPVNLDELKILWESWKSYYNKSYARGEEAARFAIFVENYKKVIEFNGKNVNVKLSLNKFADITSEEFKSFYLNPLPHPAREQSHESLTISDSFVELPSYVDWRKKGAVGPVENQGTCGSGWALPSIDTLSALYFIEQGKLVAFSQQQLIDCVEGCSNCDGCTVAQAFAYTAKYGMELAGDYPTIDGDSGACQYDASKAIRVNSGFEWVTAKSSYALKSALVNQPVAVSIEADLVFQMYSSGIISQNCGANVDHSLMVVGYQSVSGQEAFIVKNNWGTDWGEDGYAYISTDGSANGGKGVCGILSEPVIPVK